MKELTAFSYLPEKLLKYPNYHCFSSVRIKSNN